MFYYRRQEAALLDRAPVLTARFLAALLSQEDGHELWELDQIHTMVSDLIDLDATEPALRPLCEQLGRIGSPRALEFLARLWTCHPRMTSASHQFRWYRQTLGSNAVITFFAPQLILKASSQVAAKPAFL